MKRLIIGFMQILFCTVWLALPCWATVESEVLATLAVTSPPVDMAMSKDGKYVFTLTADGNVEVYLLDGKRVGQLNVGPTVDQIETGPREDLLLLKSKTDQTVQVLVLDFVQTINVAGSPFKGPEQAPVTVAVFSDFQ